MVQVLNHAFEGKGLHEWYYYCRNIAHISVILWGYVLIWYSCRDGCQIIPQKRYT